MTQVIIGHEMQPDEPCRSGRQKRSVEAVPRSEVSQSQVLEGEVMPEEKNTQSSLTADSGNHFGMLETEKTQGEMSWGERFWQKVTTRNPVTVKTADKITVKPDGTVIFTGAQGVRIGTITTTEESSAAPVFKAPDVTTTHRIAATNHPSLTATRVLPVPAKEPDKSLYEWTFAVPRQIPFGSRTLTLPPWMLPKLRDHFVIGDETDQVIADALTKVEENPGRYVLAQKKRLYRRQ